MLSKAAVSYPVSVIAVAL